MEKKNYADVLESYVIAEEGIFGKLFGGKKNNSQKKPQETNRYKEYFNFLDSVLEKIPATEIAKEKALRKKEWSAIAAISKSRPDDVEDGLEEFLDCSDFTIFDRNSFILREFDCYEDLQRTYSREKLDNMSESEWDKLANAYSDKINSECERICREINSRNFKCFEDPHVDWDKDEGTLFIATKPSAEFMEIARKFGYVSYETYLKNR